MTVRIGLAGAEATVPDPHAPSYRVALIPVRSYQRAGDGTLRADYTANKRQWTVEWRGLSSTDYSNLWTELMRESALSWEPPEGGDYTVVVISASSGRFGQYYTVQAVLEEV